jgi:peptidoglycan/xylan/chitin deacetylase (PgdA/CDA1 family)
VFDDIGFEGLEVNEGILSARLWERVRGHYTRRTSRVFFRRSFTIRPSAPLVSFTFDDFPKSAWTMGGTILRGFGVRGTYYASFGLMDTTTPSGQMFSIEDVKSLLQEGHELGCHTFDHCNSWTTEPMIFEESILRNRRALEAIHPGASFRTLSYPISEPHPFIKRRISSYFLCCRAGGPSPNVGVIDLNALGACFLEQNRDNPGALKELIDRNCRERGWLVFATHDISNSPTPYGCTPWLFEDIVGYAVGSGARVLPVAEALMMLSDSPRL